MHYCAAPSDVLSVVVLDALVAIYDRRSGQTHMVTEPVPDILAALATPLDRVALADALGLDSSDETLALLDARLGELLATGLIDAA